MPQVFGEFVYDPVRRELRKHGSIVKIDPQQLDLLACFLKFPGVLLSKQELVEHVWSRRVIADSALSVAVAKLRKVLGHNEGSQDYIENRYGRGYRFLPPVSIVADAAGDASSTKSAQPQIAHSPLVGRVQTMQRLEASLARAMKGEGGLCALLGEPGIGKTRLAETLERSAQQRGVRTAWARFLAAESAPPLWPLVRVLRTLNSEGFADEALRLLHERSSERESQVGQTTETSELTHGFLYDAMSTIHGAIDEVTRALFRLSERQPLLIILDDLQWADAASLRLINYLVGEISRWPILVLATVRDTEFGLEKHSNRELTRLLSQPKTERIELHRLSGAEIAEYVAAAFGGDGKELGHAVFARCEGNPFFMVELLRPWLGLPQPAPDQLRLSGLALDLVRQRLSAVPESVHTVLSAAAVIGRDFDLGLLSHVTERSADELLEALDGSLANDTIIASTHLPGAYAFEHELIREVLYADLAASERCRLHLRVAEGLMRRRAAGTTIASAELAHHFLAALPQGDVAVAIAHARTAAVAATRMASHAEARSLLQRALESLRFSVEPDPQTLTALLLELSLVERVLGDRAYVDHLERGVALAREHRFGTLLGIAGQMLSPSPGLQSRAGACTVLEAAAAVLPATDLAARAIVSAHLSWTPPNCLSARKVNALLDEAQRLAHAAHDLDAMSSVRDARLFFSGGPETRAQAEALADEIDRELKAHPETSRSARVVATATFRLISALQRGDRPGLEAAIAGRANALSKLNNIELNWHHERMLLIQRMNRGDFADVAADLERLRQRAQRQRLQSWPILWARDCSELLLWTGDVSQLAARMRPGLVLTDSESPTTLASKLRYLADFGYLDDARAALKALSSEAIRDLPHDRDYLGVMCQLALVSAAIGSKEHCSAIYQLLLPHAQLYSADISFHCAGSVSHWLGRLARTLELDEAARQHFETAVTRNTQFELRACALRSQRELADLLLSAPQASDVRRGQELLTRTRRDALQMGLLPLAETSDRRAS